MPQEFKRAPSIERRISEITDSDVRIRVTGTVIEASDQSIFLDDGTGKIKATFDLLQPVEVNKVVRVIGRVIPFENGVELHGEILQDMQKLDIDVFKKLQSIKNL